MSRFKVGTIFELHIDNTYYCYAQLLPHDNIAFLDYRLDTPIIDLQLLSSAPPLFITVVYSYIISKQLWKRVGWIPVRDDFKKEIEYFLYHEDTGKFEVYTSSTGQIRPSCFEDCKSLERCAVWDKNHIEDRIRDHYKCVPCRWENVNRDAFEHYLNFVHHK